MSTRNAARNVRQRKLNTKQPLRIIRENELEEQYDDEPQRHIPQVETGVEKGEEIEYHLQAVINAAQEVSGAKAKPTYIPTPEASKARGVQYDKLYPKTFSSPATYVRFSSTVEDSIGTPYCMDDNDVIFLGKLNDGKDVDGRERKDKLSQCSEDTFEEVMSFFEEASQRIQPYANIDNTPLVSLQEMHQSVEDEDLSALALKWLDIIYPHWAMQKEGGRPLMPTIKVRVLDTTSEADDADPYVCFRRREVRQTRKTRGRDAQVVEKLKKLRLELEQARQLVQMVVQREKLNTDQLEISRKVFEQRGQLKRVKVEKNIIGDKGEDEELLINQKPIPKPKPRQSIDQRPGPTIRLRTSSDRQAPDNDLVILEDRKAEAQANVELQIQNRKVQHRRWNEHWQDHTWAPITPPLEPINKPSGWGFLQAFRTGYPTPPPTLPSEGSQKEGDIEMTDAPAPISPQKDEHCRPGAPSPEPEVIVMSMPGAFPQSPYDAVERNPIPACRLRKGRGGRWYLEAKKKRKPRIFSGVVTDSDDSEDDLMPDYHPVNDRMVFEYRCALNKRPEPALVERKASADAGASTQQHAAAG